MNITGSAHQIGEMIHAKFTQINKLTYPAEEGFEWTSEEGVANFPVILRDLVTPANSFTFLSGPQFMHA